MLLMRVPLAPLAAKWAKTKGNPWFISIVSSTLSGLGIANVVEDEKFNTELEWFGKAKPAGTARAKRITHEIAEDYMTNKVQIKFEQRGWHNETIFSSEGDPERLENSDLMKYMNLDGRAIQYSLKHPTDQNYPYNGFPGPILAWTESGRYMPKSEEEIEEEYDKLIESDVFGHYVRDQVIMKKKEKWTMDNRISVRSNFSTDHFNAAQAPGVAPKALEIEGRHGYYQSLQK